MSTHSNAHANAKKCIFDSQFPGNWFEFGIIENDFWSSTIWAIQIQDSFAGFKNPKIPGIQPTYNTMELKIRWESLRKRSTLLRQAFLKNCVYKNWKIIIVQVW